MAPDRGRGQAPEGGPGQAPDQASVVRSPSAGYSDGLLRAILGSAKTIAIVGATPNLVRPSHLVMKYLLGKGYRVVPINPGHAGREILGQKVYARLGDVAEPIDMVDIFRRADALGGVVDEALKLDPRPRVIWMQLGLRDDAAAARAERAGVTVVMDRCSKIEYGRLCGENAWAGINSRQLSSRKPVLAAGYQHFLLPPEEARSAEGATGTKGD